MQIMQIMEVEAHRAGEVKEAVARTGPPSDRSKLKPAYGDSNRSTAGNRR